MLTKERRRKMHNPFEILQNELQDIKKMMLEMQSTIQTPQLKEETKYLTREDVAAMLQINVSSVFNWTKSRVLKSYQISGRVYYKLHEIEAAIVELKK